MGCLSWFKKFSDNVHSLMLKVSTVMVAVLMSGVYHTRRVLSSGLYCDYLVSLSRFHEARTILPATCPFIAT